MFGTSVFGRQPFGLPGGITSTVSADMVTKYRVLYGAYKVLEVPYAIRWAFDRDFGITYAVKQGVDSSLVLTNAMCATTISDLQMANGIFNIKKFDLKLQNKMGGIAKKSVEPNYEIRISAVTDLAAHWAIRQNSPAVSVNVVWNIAQNNSMIVDNNKVLVKSCNESFVLK